MLKSKFSLAVLALAAVFAGVVYVASDVDAQSASQKKISKYVPPLAEQKLDYLAGAPQGNTSILVATVTATTTVKGLDFRALFGVTFKDTNYKLILQSNLASPLSVGTKQTHRVQLGDVQNNEVIDVVVIGKIAGQP